MARDGSRVFIVEDEIILSLELDGRLGCLIAGRAASLHDALGKADRLDFDLAIVDLELGRQSGEPVIEAVTRRRIPMIITSGYDLPQAHARHKLLPKPYTLEDLRLAVDCALSGGHRQ